MLVGVGLLLLRLVAAQETTADSASVESLQLRADVSINELSDAVLKLVDPAETSYIRVDIQAYRQEVTLKSTVRNVDDGIEEDGGWQGSVIDAASSVDLGPAADDVAWGWARPTPIRRLDPNTVVVKFVMTWTPGDLSWRDTTAVRILQESDFTAKFATEMRDRAAGDADTAVQSPVITTVSLSVNVAFPDFESALSARFNEETSAPGSDEAADTITLGDDSGHGGGVVIAAIVVAAVCVCCGLAKVLASYGIFNGAAKPNVDGINDTSATSWRPVVEGSAATAADGSIGVYAHSENAGAPASLKTGTGTSASGRAAANTDVGGLASGYRQDVARHKAACLAEAVFHGNVAAIATFARDINEKVQGRFTPLYIAARNNDVASAKQLLLHGADVNACTRGGSTALCRAAQGGNAEVLKVLLDHPNVEINKQRGAGRTALFLAVENGHEECVQLLLDNGAAVDLCVFDSTNQTKWNAQQFADRRVAVACSANARGDAKISAGQARYEKIAAMLRGSRVDDAHSTSHIAATLDPSQSGMAAETGTVAATGAGGVLPPPHPATDNTAARVPVVPDRDHGDIDDSSSDDSDPGSTVGDTQDRRPPVPTENMVASSMAVGVTAATTGAGGALIPSPALAAIDKPKDARTARFSHTAAMAASSAMAPVVPPRGIEAGGLGSDSETSSSDSASSSGSDLVERPIPRIQAAVVASATAPPQVPPRGHHDDALDEESDDSSWGDEGDISLGI